jgi:hypothetical protein
MTIILRSVKGSNLTPAEVDGNFIDLDGRVITLETTPPTPVEITNITVSGSQMTVHLSDMTTFGPFTLPRSRFAWRGTWAASTQYYGNDVLAFGEDIYLVLEAHISDTAFDPAATDGSSGNPLYALMLSSAPQIKTVSSIAYMPAADDANKYIRMTHPGDTSGDPVVTIPGNQTVAFAVGVELHFRQSAGAQISFVGESNSAETVTLNVTTGHDLMTAQEGAVVTCKKIATNTWDVFGLLAETVSV